MMRNFRHWLYFSAAACLAAVAGCGGEDAATQAPEPSAVAETPAAETSVESALSAMANDHAVRMLQEAPEYATILGVDEAIAGEDYNSRLGQYGFAASLLARELNESFLQDIRSIDRNGLSGGALVTYDVLQDAYRMAAQRNQFSFGGSAVFGSSGPYIVSLLSGPHLFLPRLLQTQHPMATAEDAESYLARLSEFGRVFDEVMESLGGDAALGVTPPYFALEGAVSSMTSFTAAPAKENPLTTTFAAKLEAIEGLSEEERNAMTARAAEIVDTVVYPAFARLSAALEGLVPQSGQDAGVWRLGEEGVAFYQHALNSYGAGGLTGDEVHEIGLREVERITAEMDAILKAEGLTEGSVAERFESIGDLPDMVYPNTDEGREALLQSLRGQVDEVLAAAPDLFGTLPSQPIEVRRIPVYEQDSAPGGYYTGPSLDGARPGIYWINLKDTRDFPKHALKTLTYHEAVPGHHFQISLERSAGLPLLRNMLGYSEYAEGWALYAEALAAEIGMYEDDPFGDLGRLQAELFRAARLVVDTGLHAKQWSREQAIDYLQSVTGDTRNAVTREIERYAVWPAQAVSYKLGMLKMMELRARAEEELGDGFDIRAFHDEVLLSGAMPLPVLEMKINRWIAAQKG